MLHEKALARARAGTGKHFDFAGNWKNELGSEMTLVQTGDILSGQYESAVSSEGTKTSGDLQGYTDGDLISFVVHWRDFQAITAWVGQLDPKSTEVTIKTLWEMTRQVDPGDEWASINSGSDVFTRE